MIHHGKRKRSIVRPDAPHRRWSEVSEAEPRPLPGSATGFDCRRFEQALGAASTWRSMQGTGTRSRSILSVLISSRRRGRRLAGSFRNEGAGPLIQIKRTMRGLHAHAANVSVTMSGPSIVSSTLPTA